MPRRLYLIPQKSLISGCGLNSLHQLSHLIVYNRNARLENRPSADPKQRGSVHKARNSYAEFQNPLYLRRAPNHSLAQILAMPSQNQNFKRHPRFHNADSRPKKATPSEPSPRSFQSDMQSTKRRCSLLFPNPPRLFLLTV